MIITQCGVCRQSLEVPDGYAGRPIKCPKCGDAIVVEPGVAVARRALTVEMQQLGDSEKRSLSSKMQPHNARWGKSEDRAADPSVVKKADAAATEPSTACYPEILTYAARVRWGASIVEWIGWTNVVLGSLFVLGGVLIMMISGKSQVGLAVVVAGVTQVVSGILLVAIGAFFRLISHTCEAVRDHVTKHR